MQGTWVTAPNISGMGNITPLPGCDSMGNPLPMQVGDYDTRGNYIGVPLRNYDRQGNYLSSLRPIIPDPPSYNTYFEEKKRKNDYENNFQMPNKYEFKPVVQDFDPFKTLEPKIPKFQLPRIDPIVQDFDPFKTLKSFEQKKKKEPWEIF